MKKITSILAMAVCTVFIASAQAPDSKGGNMSAEQAAMMQKWKEYMTPGEVHAMMAKSTGEWNAEVTMWMDPSAPPSKSTAVATNTMILGGRYQQSTHKGTFEGMPFEGMSIVGYDNAKKKFYSTWVDNMGTGIMYLEGTYDPATKTTTYTGKQVDPMTGQDMEIRETFTIVDDNTHMLTMYMTAPGGKEFKTMEIRFTRK